MDRPLRSALRKPTSTSPSVPPSSSPTSQIPSDATTSHDLASSSQTGPAISSAADDVPKKPRKQTGTVPSSPPVICMTAGESLAAQAKCVKQGLVDAFAFPPAFITIYGSKTIQQNVLKCVLLNGLIFLGSVFLFDVAILPISRRLRTGVFTVTGGADMKDSGRWFDTLFVLTYYTFWVYPIYIVTFVLNAMWYQKIAERSFRVQVGKPVTVAFSYQRLITLLTSESYRALLLLNFLIQSALVYFIPIFGPPLSFVCFCWSASFYAFEYRWGQKGWTLEQQIEHFERHWAYYFGFGFPCTLLTFFFPQIVSQGLFALIFPLYIILCNRASPLPKPNWQIHHRFLPERLPIFRLAVITNGICLRRLGQKRRVRAG
ncbi:etoposide-induced protein 2.4-domain-containing protein [Fimicolochytrium jonesii]|uniref:etoposide-induced protein 2.4-domain-containing protein n=1 Tax=Fimicolochytrium jonesii TaxID=1396493 RepID=UPI0022FE04F7|nr:etoposide-induced protein 2.4-domain-containing protein [Fimicolochytrium jonesii]KAI8815706.1 etoposide-induced protein 2.4-domain-containing protein [Fimicolochytrium jonesii]